MVTVNMALVADELTPGACKVVASCRPALALYNVDGRFFATDNACPHQGGPLGKGSLEARRAVLGADVTK